MVSWLHVQIEQKWNSWLDKTTSYKFYLPSNKSFCVPWNEKASLKHSWYNTAVQAIRECQHIPQILPKIYRKNIYAQMRVFLTFFYLLHGVKDLPEIYRWLNLVKSIFSNFFGQKTIFEPSLSFSTMTTSMKNWKWFDCVVRESQTVQK